MEELVTVLELLRINTIAQLTTRTRAEVASLMLERRGLEAQAKRLIEQIGEDARWEVAGYEAWANDLISLLLKAQRGRSLLAA